MTIMTFGMALISRILTGEEPCLRKVQYSRMYEIPADSRLIKHKLNHELLISKVIDELNGEIYIVFGLTNRYRKYGSFRIKRRI